MITERRAVAITVLALTAALCLATLGWSRTAAFLPRIVGVPLLAACTLQVVFELRQKRAEERIEGRALGSLASAAVLLAGLFLAGFAIALPLYAGFTWKRSGAGWIRSAILASIVAAATYATFRVLPIEPFHGLLGLIIR